ncbi:hypothetical protein PORY_000534, partial [Pneumocystis oryctolagi]
NTVSYRDKHIKNTKNMIYKKTLFYICTVKNKQIKLLHFYRDIHFNKKCRKLIKRTNTSVYQKLYTKMYTTMEEKNTLKHIRKSFKENTNIYKEFDWTCKDPKVDKYFPKSQEFEETLKAILWKFKAPISFSFAYGSGVFKQEGNNVRVKKPMIDFIFGVSHAQHWHSLNLSSNKDHYSFLKYFGSYFISYLQKKMGANVYYNPYVKINDIIIKYGIVTIDDLCKELIEWNTLYLSGRMHKPIKILKNEPRVKIAYITNLIAALRVAMLLLPEKFSEHELYSTISKISYTGDIRMRFAENPYKVESIVNCQILDFRQLYFPLINMLPNIQIISNEQIDERNKILVQDFNPVSRANMIQHLPKTFKDRLYYIYNQKTKYKKQNNSNELCENNDFEKMIVKDDNFHAILIKTIETTVYWPSISQSLKGILSGGIYKSWNYLIEKMHKKCKH